MNLVRRGYQHRADGRRSPRSPRLARRAPRPPAAGRPARRRVGGRSGGPDRPGGPRMAAPVDAAPAHGGFGHLPVPRGALRLQQLDRLRNLRDGLLVDADLLLDALVAHAVEDLEPVDDHRRVVDHAPELRVLAHIGDLLGRAAQRRVALQPAVRVQQRYVEALDAPVLLHAAVEADRLVEDLERPLLAATRNLTPPDEQHAFGHGGSFPSRPGQVPGLLRGLSQRADAAEGEEPAEWAPAHSTM